MKPRPTDPQRLDIAALAAEGGVLEGHWAVERMSRLAASMTPPQDTAPGDIAWHAAGQRVPVTGAQPEVWLHIEAKARVWLTCQRCLQPFECPIEIDRRLRFVRDEAEAEALDAELEDDVLALPRTLDLRELIEDELLLALPLVPRHDTCPAPLNFMADPDEVETPAERKNPFAALQALKTRRGQ